MRAPLIAVLLLSLWPCYAQSQDIFEGACTPGHYDSEKGIGRKTKGPECYTSKDMIRALTEQRSFPVVMATSTGSKTATRLFTFNVQSHEGYELLVNAPIISCARAKEIGVIEQCPNPELLDAFGATKAIVVDRYDQAQFMDIKAKGARSFNHDANVMFRARSISRNLAFSISKNYRGASAGTGFQHEVDSSNADLSTYEFIDYTADGKALLGNP